MLENFASPEEVQRLRSKADELVDSFSPESVSVFSTKSQVMMQRLTFVTQSCFGRKCLHPHLRALQTQFLSIVFDCCFIVQTKKTDQYFLDSASNVSFFFEEDAFAEDGSLRQAKALSINKIGHGRSSLLQQVACL